MNAGSFNILIAEDNDVSREMMASILKAKGYNIFGAIDGGSAIEVINAHKIDMAYVDINMHPLGGFEFIKHLIVKGRKLPVVIVTSDTSGDTLMKASALGIKQLMNKPVNPERLLMVTERVLSGAGHYISPLTVTTHDTKLTPADSMMKAAQIARKNIDTRSGGPFGAVLCDEEGRILGEGANGITSRVDPTAHAEVMAIRQAAERLGSSDLSHCTLYCTGEPTMMGKALIASVGIQKVYFSLSHSDMNLLRDKTYVMTETSYEKIEHDDVKLVYQMWEDLQSTERLDD